jgi:hypothetical protein
MVIFFTRSQGSRGQTSSGQKKLSPSQKRKKRELQRAGKKRIGKRIPDQKN